MKISYAIPVCNEYVEIQYLIEYLLNNKRDKDEIIIQCDEGNTTPEVYTLVKQFENVVEELKVIEFPLNGDFATFKNNLKNHCSGDYIFQIDADEYPDDYLMDTIESVIKINNKVDVFWVPRINKVEGLTKKHIEKWRWNVDDRGRVNFPDYQCRIFKNVKRIKWENKVHEKLVGHKTETQLPANDEFCLIHIKDIQRQESQNQFYSTL